MNTNTDLPLHDPADPYQYVRSDDGALMVRVGPHHCVARVGTTKQRTP